MDFLGGILMDKMARYHQSHILLKQGLELEE